jgi:hypothetical protein
MKVDVLVANISRNVRSSLVTLEMCSEMFIRLTHFATFKLSIAKKEP